MSLRKELIKVALKHPETREHLVPLIRKQATPIPANDISSIGEVLFEYILQATELAVPHLRNRFPEVTFLRTSVALLRLTPVEGLKGVSAQVSVDGLMLHIEVANPVGMNVVRKFQDIPLAGLEDDSMRSITRIIAEYVLRLSVKTGAL